MYFKMKGVFSSIGSRLTPRSNALELCQYWDLQGLS